LTRRTKSSGRLGREATKNVPFAGRSKIGGREFMIQVGNVTQIFEGPPNSAVHRGFQPVGSQIGHPTTAKTGSGEGN